MQDQRPEVLVPTVLLPISDSIAKVGNVKVLIVGLQFPMLYIHCIYHFIGADIFHYFNVILLICINFY